MRYPLFILYTALLLPLHTVSGQYYDTGQDPSSIKWMQIKTGRFTVIYPKNYEAGGRAFTSALDDAYSKMGSIFPDKKFKIPVVIHSFTTQPNGYVAWAPRRMEIYPTPEQNTIPLDQNKQLALHELTHVFQMESLNQGFTKAMSLVLGEQFTGVVASLLPLWLLEGNAVFAETVLSGSGRGRSPSFQKQLKALAVEKGSCFTYDKGLNGSYRDFVPDHYQSGYQMVTWSMAKYDPQIWNKVLKYTAEEPFTLNPVNISLRKSARLTKKKLYKETFDTLKTIWTKEVSGDKTLKYEAMNPDKDNKYINYYSPVFAGTDSIIAIRTSLSAPPAFVLINPSDKTERRIHIPGQMYPWFISYANGKILWVESQMDKRWENRNYSVIKLLNLSNNQTKTLSHRSRYLSASLSPDGNVISATENTSGNINNLILIDAQTGKILQTVEVPGNSYLQRPQWAEGGEKITVIFLTENGEGIMSYSPANHSWETLIEAGNEDLQSSFLRNDSLFFISSRSGTDNIYLSTPGKTIKCLTRSRFGASDLFLKGDNVYFSDYTSGGNSVCSTKISAAPETGPADISSSSFLINRIEISRQAPDNSSVYNYTPVPYRKWQHLFRFHSWMPFYADIEQVKSDPASIRPGIMAMTQNSLSTLISTIGYEYSQEKNHVFHTRITWKGWYPVIESQFDYGYDSQIFKVGETVSNPTSTQPGLRFSNSISFPFQFSSGRFSEYLRPSFSSEYLNRYIYIKEDGAYDFGQTILTGRLYFSNYHRSAVRDIYPRWSQVLDLNYSFAPFDKRIYGSVGSLKTAFYFPGILPNNGIKIRFEKEKQDPEKFLYGRRASFPRGYNNMTSKEFEFLSFDYVLPLAYPDFNISSLLYLKRLRTGLFYDQVSGKGNSFLKSTVNGLTPMFTTADKKTFSSFGLELMADFHVLRIPYMISGGVQAAWKNLSEKPVFGLLFNIDLYGMSLGKREL